MTYSALPTLITNTVAALGASTALAGVRIFDGPEVDESWPGDWIGVGHDGNGEGDVEAGSIAQEYGPLSPQHRKYEDGTLNCIVSCWDGTTDLTSRRARAFVLLDAVAAVVRTDPTLSGAVLYTNGPADAQMTYWQTSQGAAVRLTFTFTYRALV